MADDPCHLFHTTDEGTLVMKPLHILYQTSPLFVALLHDILKICFQILFYIVWVSYSDSLLSFASDITAASPFLEESGIRYRGWGDGFAESLVIEVMEYKRITFSLGLQDLLSK